MKSLAAVLASKNLLSLVFFVCCMLSARSFRILASRRSHWFHHQQRPIRMTQQQLASTTQHQNDGKPYSVLPSNQELAQQRLEIARAKKQARQRSIQQKRVRHLHIKELLQNDNDYSLYAIKVSVCDELRQELKLSGKEKRGRIFLESNSTALTSLEDLHAELLRFFRALRKSSFVVSAGFPQSNTTTNGTTMMESQQTQYWPVQSDQEVVETFQTARDYANKHGLPRPSISLYLQRDPNDNRPSPPPYLTGMPNPADSQTISMLSFYSFTKIADPSAFAEDLRKLWKPFQALGRVYVAMEGVNAQMSVPTNVLPQFIECCQSIPGVGENMENGINVDPRPLTRDEYAVAGVPAAGGKPVPPFTNLYIRVRRQIVADGLEDRALDWQQAGYDMPPMEWHEALKQNNTTSKQKPIVLDCRNTYETDVGRFEGAEPLGTENFRDSWSVLQERLKDVPKDTPVYGYCTGGIRCVKVGAYVTQELGFTNFRRLAGGIIAYDRTLQEKAPEEESLFKGTNFVFDNRLGRSITEDTLGMCVTCGAETSLVSNCRNDNCHKRMIQCDSCVATYMGTCSDACRLRLVNGMMVPERAGVVEFETKPFTSLDEYSNGHSSPPPSVYPEIEHNTRALIPSGSHMVSGGTQGRLLKQMASMTREGRILELGTFTGYATACFLEGAALVGQFTQTAGSRQEGPYVMSMERDGRAFDVASAQLSCICKYGTGEVGAEALCGLRNSEVPSIQDDVVTLQYDNVVTTDIVHVSDALASIESLAAGTSDLQPAPFDLIFIDADKTRLIDYAEACLSSDRVLKKGGIMVVDNVLWKGLVLEASGGDHPDDDDSLSMPTDDSNELKRNRRSRKLANKMHRFNSQIVQDDRVEVLVLPVRDGLSVIRKK